MREIEIKAKLRNEEHTLRLLNKLGVKLGKPVTQHDVVFGKPGAIENAFDSNWLRIRTENNKTVTFTLKRSVHGHLDSIEHETIVENAKELEAIIKSLGFELYSDLTKVRQRAKYGDIEICYDKLPNLGAFIEAEKIMNNDADHDTVVEELWNLFEDLGISRGDEEEQGYDVLERTQRLSAKGS